MESMNEKEIMRVTRVERKVTQTVLAGRLGMSQNALSANMLRKRTSLGMFVNILGAMDYDVCVIDRETGEIKWKVEVDD